MATWREVISRGGEYLAAKGIDDACAAVEFLAARLLHTGRGLLSAHLDAILGEKHLEAMRRGVKRLAVGEPLQYILGEWDFRTLTLKCDSRALIPRPETEGLVSLVLDFLRSLKTPGRKPVVVDVGTGTGAIILSIAAEFKGEAILVGTDFSAVALSLARENAAKTALESKVRFLAMDGLDDFDEPGTIDAIVSNPPYIATEELAHLEHRVRSYEPHMALDGGKTGMDFYERYVTDAMNLLSPGGGIFFEIGSTQGPAVRSLLESCGFSGVTIARDLAGLDRYAYATLA